MTIDDLGAMIVKSFADSETRMNERFDDVYERFDRMDERFERLEGKVVQLEGKMDILTSEFRSSVFDNKKVKERVEILEVHSFGSIQEA